MSTLHQHNPLVFIIFYITAGKFTKAINKFSFPVNQGKNANVVFFTNAEVICTKSRSSMNDTGTIFCGYEIAQ